MKYRMIVIIVIVAIYAFSPNPGINDAGKLTCLFSLQKVNAEEPLSKGLEALENAATYNRYLFIFFSNSDDETTISKKNKFEEILSNLTDKADSLAININDPTESEIVKKFGVARAPMPLVLAIASSGVVTAGFPKEFTEKQLTDAFATPCMEKSLKAFQDRKLVFVCVQNGKTKANDAAMKGVNDFKADAKYTKITEIITLDPSDTAEQKFMKKLQINPETEAAETLFMVPPGRILGKFTGATTKEEIVQTITKASSGCGPGSSSGCCPPKK